MIMKRFLLLFCLLFVPCLAAQAETYRVEDIPNVQRADRTRYVSNPDGILSDEAVAHIDRLCAALRERAVAQVAVVAVDDIAGGDVFDFAIDLFSAWGVGQARNDNGLGILLVKDRREIRFVTGGGLEGVLPDAICKRIQLKYMLPAFRQGDYSLGMVQGVEAVSQLLEGSELDLGGTDTAGDELPAWAVFLIVTGFVVVPMGVILLGYYARKRCPKCHKLTLRQQSSDILKVTPNYRLVEYTYVCSNCGAVVKRQAKNLRDDNFGGGAGGQGGFAGCGRLFAGQRLALRADGMPFRFGGDKIGTNLKHDIMKKWIWIGVVAVVVIFFYATYNGFVNKEEGLKTAWSNVETQYQRRADLIPNLVNTVKGYAAHESQTFEAVTEARAKATSINLSADDLTPGKLAEFQQAQAQVRSALGRLIAVSESYPDLKANQNFLELQAQLEGTENRISVARKEFNEVAKTYNVAVRRFPANLVAKLFGFGQKPYFEAAEGTETAPRVQF